MEHPPAQQPQASRDWAGLSNSHVEVFVVVLLVVFTALMMPAWAHEREGTEYVPDFLGQMVSPWLLPALGLLWVVRCRSVDLSVWVGFGIGAAVAGRIAEACPHPAATLAGVVGAGLLLGGVNALAVAGAGLPGWGATGITALVGVSVATTVAGPLDGTVQGPALRPWSGSLRPLLVVGALYAVVMLSALYGGRLRARRGWSGRSALAAAMVASGVLSALGGLCWVCRFGRVPGAFWLVDDLRVPAAVVLTGAVVFRGPRRGLLAGLLLPPSMLLATIWRYRVWDFAGSWLAVNLILLCVMALAAQWAITSPGLVKTRRGQRAGLALFCGLCILALTARNLPAWLEAPLHAAGVIVWLTGLAVTVGRQRAELEDAGPNSWWSAHYRKA